ncbi:MAG TPA: EamA family transporter, partial [Actinomycetota bacterium]|nr:EamA family transporter [Actinomycetota bacterium]
MNAVALILALLAALGYGSSDFAAGIGGRRTSVGGVVLAQQPVAALATLVVWALSGPSSPTAAALTWGALSGLGNGFGTIALYRGLAVARMSVVASLSAVLAAVIPAGVGIALGDRLSVPEATGLVL